MSMPPGAFVVRSVVRPAAGMEESRCHDRVFARHLDAEGLHARPVALVASAVHPWESSVTVTCRGASTSARDLMGLMGLCARRGDELAVRVEGPDEEACAAALREVFTF